MLLFGKKILITAGRTIEYLDPVRIITNKSTGKMGMAVARASLAAGAEVTVIFGKGSVPPPSGVKSLPVETSDEMKEAVFDELGREHYDIVISTAAVGDWKAKKPFLHKVSTRDNKTIDITLVPTQKIIDTIKEQFPDIFLVAFRAQTNMTEEELLRDAFERLKTAKADLIAVNDIGKAGSGFEEDTNELFVIDDTGKQYHIPNTSKSDAAETLVNIITGKY
jgi:phosphopantothenoylcysteine decarboxylase/phosphopantothenate--cysteine ligase